MAATTVKKDRASTWNIVGDKKTWTLAEKAKIDAEPAIVVASGTDGNRLLINGDIDATGRKLVSCSRRPSKYSVSTSS